MDCRGQNAQSQDLSHPPEGHSTGWMTQGIRDPKTYYYRYVYADALRALELLAQREEVDEHRLAITGASQGGGLSLAVAALSDRPALALPDIPFLCDYRRAIEIAELGETMNRKTSRQQLIRILRGHTPEVQDTGS